MDDGDIKNRRLAVISKSFYLQQTVVTQEQYQAVTGLNPVDAMYDNYVRMKIPNLRRKDYINPSYPVVQVTWSQASAFCTKLGETQNRTFRLPTEVEWEYAARGGDGDRFLWAGSNDDAAVSMSYEQTEGYLKPVKMLQPNGYDLYDMSGLVEEWCADGAGKLPETELIDFYQPNGRQERGVDNRNLRGGHYNARSPETFTLPRRGSCADAIDEDLLDYIGFRLLMVV